MCLLHVYMRIVMASVSVLTYQAFVNIGPPALGIGSVIQPTFLLNVTMCSSWTGHSDDSHSFYRLLSQRPHRILVFAFTCQFFSFLCTHTHRRSREIKLDQRVKITSSFNDVRKRCTESSHCRLLTLRFQGFGASGKRSTVKYPSRTSSNAAVNGNEHCIASIHVKRFTCSRMDSASCALGSASSPGDNVCAGAIYSSSKQREYAKKLSETRGTFSHCQK